MSLFDQLLKENSIFDMNSYLTEDKTGDDTQEENPPQADPTADTGEEDEYSMDDPDDTNTEDTPDDNEDPNEKLKSLEKSIFDQLSEEQKQSKTKELKSLYSNVYQKCQDIIDIVSAAEKEPDKAKVYDYIINTLVDLQKYIRDYLDTLFDSKTYIENMTELQKYLAILDTVNNVFEEIKKGIDAEAK